MNPLTDRQQQIYDIIKREIGNGRPPTVRQIGAETGIRSPNGVMCHLNALEKKGYITRDARLSRGIGLVAPSVGTVASIVTAAQNSGRLWTKIHGGTIDAPPSVLLWLEDVLKPEVENE